MRTTEHSEPMSTARIDGLRTATAPVEPVRWVWHLAAFAVVLGAAVPLIQRYEALPDPYPIHYDLTGTADGFAPKSLAMVLLPVLIGVATTVLFAVVDVAQRRSARQRLARPQGRYDHLDWTSHRSGRIFPMGPASLLSAVTLAGAALPTVLGTAAAMTLVWGGVAGLVVLAVVGAVRSRRS
ncbi:DUF1648 domain-containing protein [Actinomyces haliotis]|uniref:DUF1648 domain-containing protein n=1 Tax=Actinomyces haliotis TaxID=1280843 RepID=UPI00188FB030|nr:DUF1648 domain-containing protein [Actinomyces haliotis]